MSIKRYSDAEVEKLKGWFEQYYSFEFIAKKLRRSTGSVSQQVRRLGLIRDHRLVGSVNYHGIDILKHGNTPEAIRASREALHAAEKDAKAAARKAMQDSAIKALRKDLKTIDRNTAIKKAHAAGASLSQIGEVVGLTKQAIGLVVTPPKRPRERWQGGSRKVW